MNPVNPGCFPASQLKLCLSLVPRAVDSGWVISFPWHSTDPWPCSPLWVFRWYLSACQAQEATPSGDSGTLDENKETRNCGNVWSTAGNMAIQYGAEGTRNFENTGDIIFDSLNT